MSEPGALHAPKTYTVSGHLGRYSGDRQIVLPIPAAKLQAVTIDLREVTRIWPISALLLLSRIKLLVRNRCGVTILPPKSPAVQTYLRAMNFYGCLGITSLATSHPPAPDVPRYKMITEIRGDVIDFTDGDPLEGVLEIIQELNIDPEFSKSIHQAIVELCDNAIRHSKSIVHPLFCMQRSGPFLDAAIVDLGIGIRGSYEANKPPGVDLRIPDHEIILHYAVRGVTSDATTGRGMGHRKARRLIGLNGGSLVIYSGNGYYKDSHEGEEAHHMASFVGTAIGIRLHESKPVSPDRLTVVTDHALSSIRQLNLGF